MPIQAGDRLASYEVLSPLGAGAMGEVWRARDTKLDRDVAIKLLPEHFAKDAERLQRFEREAKAVASLNHANIAQIHGFERVGDTRFLVLELVPGETLAERIARGPLPIQEALEVCVQIAAGVESAHEAGVIHRDLKPGNVKLTPEGKVKVLDFGLARQERHAAAQGSDPKGPLTEEGVLLGTPGYMSPEQVRGKPIDRRSDVFAFGCVLYACLTGDSAFPGETSSDVIAAILEGEPDFAALPEKTSPRVRELLAKCLEKDLGHRLRDIGDARIELERAIANKEWGTARLATLADSSDPRSPLRRLAPWLAGGLIGAGATVLVLIVAAPKLWPAAPAAAGTPRTLTHFVVNPARLPAFGEFDTTATLAISSDGARVAFIARDPADGNPKLYLREMEGLDAAPVPGSTFAHDPFFSPDGAWLAFSSDDRLWKVPVAGGPRIELSKLPGFHKGSSWGGDGICCSAGASVSLSRLSSDGGDLAPLSELDVAKGETSQRWPELLPDGRHVLCTIKKSSIATFDEAEIAVYSLDSRVWKTVLRGGYYGRYSRSGHLLYVREGALMAAPFDLEKLEVTKAGVRMVPGVMCEPGSGAAQFALSSNGTLLYVAGGPFENRTELVWIDKSGVETSAGCPVRTCRELSLSPDGKRIAQTIAGATDIVSVFDIARGTLTRTTFEGNCSAIAWTPDGESLVYTSDRDGGGIFMSRADGSGVPTKLMADLGRYADFTIVGGSKPVMLYCRGDGSARDIWQRSLEPGAPEVQLIQNPLDQSTPRVSPDGHWLAYLSEESGQQEVYVCPYPSGAGRWQLSKDGAYSLDWSSDSTKVYFLSGTRSQFGDSEYRRSLLAVSISTVGGFTVGPPEKAFEWTGLGAVAVAPGGERLLTLRRRSPAYRPTEITAVLNWFDELRSKAPAR